MRVGTLLKIVAGLVFLVIVAVVVAVLVFDPNAYKDDIVAAVEDETGRPFSIESEIDLKLGLTPSLAVRGVRLGNAEWASRPDMVTVGEFAAEIAAIPLIFGNLQINRLVLRDAEIVIETNAQGRSNLDFAAAEKERDANGGDTARLPQVNDVLIENAVLTLINGEQGTTTRLELRRLAAAAESLTSPLEIEMTGTATLDGQAIEFDAAGEVGAPTLLVGGGRPYPVDISASGLGLEVALKGEIAEPAAARGIDLKVAVSGDDLQGLRPIAGEGLPAAGPLELTAIVKGDATNLAFEDLVLQWGRSDLRGRAAVDVRGPRPSLTASLQAERIDLTELVPADGEPARPADTRVTGTPAKVFPSDPLPLDVLRTVDAKLEFGVGQLVTPGATLSDVDGELALDNGALAIRPFAGELAGSALSGDLALDTRSRPAQVAFNLKAPALDLGAVLREFADLDRLRGSGAVDVSVRGAGRSVAEIMGSLNGYARLLMGEGEMKNEFLGNISGLGQTIGEAFGKKEWIVVECIASDFEIARGIATSRVNVINTEVLLITAEGKIDLGQETPAIKVTPQSKGIDLSLAVPVNIGGTLADPTFTPDALSTARKIGGILGAVAFPPAAIIGLGEMGSADNPCVQILKEGSRQQPESEPASPVESVPEKAKETLEDIGEGLKRIFGR